ncbi:hypothetical protein [Limnobacter parvus]|uniref:Uncharacterized protein n=1 Tax=Limnobacter parvus TaxID=2939690 RepID=A0ABT1XJ34_9BURK|nr:hypothetical protein [Limnobacter parvus]MCR2747291.1 hypothetical protein [Limnobacter parvus]
MSRFWKTVTQWLVALLLGAFLFQALAASASELCRLQCQKDWKTNAASIGVFQGEPTDQWSSFSTPCPDLSVGNDSVPADSNACNECGMCALNPVFAVQQVHAQMVVKHPPQSFLEPPQVQAWLNDRLFKPPRV